MFSIVRKKKLIKYHPKKGNDIKDKASFLPIPTSNAWKGGPLRRYSWVSQKRYHTEDASLDIPEKTILKWISIYEKRGEWEKVKDLEHQLMRNRDYRKVLSQKKEI